MAQTSGDYQFSAEPREVKASTQKYREPLDQPQAAPLNIMHDKRVVRGNTYAQMVIPASTQQEMERQQEMEQKRHLQSQQRRQAEEEEMQREISTPEAVEGRKHIDVQTENFIEELTDKPPEYEIETQTDFNIDRPSTPLFMPKKIGEDKDTQIEDGELFCFNEEVDPILRVLCGKMLELSRMEVLEEEELKEMRRHQREFEQKRDAELIEVQRLEQEEREKKEEADKRKKQMQERRQQRQFAHKKFCCRIYSKRYLAKLRKGSLTVMRDLGTFRPPQELAFYDQLLPWIAEDVMGRLQGKRDLDEALFKMLNESTADVSDRHARSVQAEANRRTAIRIEELRVAQETEQRKATRVEMRAKRAAWIAKNELRSKIQAQLIDIGTQKDGVVNTELSDFDEATSAPIAGTVGGMLMELAVLLHATEEIMGTQLTTEQVAAILAHFCNNFVKGDSALLVNTIGRTRWNSFVADELLAEGDEPPVEEVKTDTFHEMAPEQFQRVLDFVGAPSNHREDSPLAIVWQDQETYHIREELIKDLVVSLVQLLSLKEEDEGYLAKERVRWTLVEDVESEPPARQALVRIIVPLNREVVQADPEEDEQAGDTEQAEAATPEAQPEAAETVEPTDAIPEEPPEPIKPYLAPEPDENFPEIEYEDRAHLIPTQSLELTVYTLNQLSQRLIRQDMIGTLRSMKDYEHLNTEIMAEKVQEVADEIESKVVERLAGDLPVFKFEIN